MQENTGGSKSFIRNFFNFARSVFFLLLLKENMNPLKRKSKLNFILAYSTEREMKDAKISMKKITKYQELLFFVRRTFTFE